MSPELPAISSPARKAVAELTGTMFLTMAVVGSGIAAQRLSPDTGIQLLANSLATGAALVTLIATFQPVSAAFNPLVTALELIAGELSAKVAGLLVGAQVAGACIGTVLANLMFDLDPITLSHHHRAGSGAILAEIIAATGLLLVIVGAVRTSRTTSLPMTVAGFITAAYWFTSSTSFANPALTTARTLSDTFAGIAPASVPGFVLAQLAGTGIAVGLTQVIWPAPRRQKPRHQARASAR